MTRRRRHSLLYELYLHSPLWRVRRRIWILRAHGRCQRCGRRRRPVTIHHLTYKRLGHERRVDVAVLCWPCHQARHPNKRTAAPQASLALGGLFGRTRWGVRTLRALVLLASFVLVVRLTPTLLTLIAPHR